MKALIVDDEEDIGIMLSKILLSLNVEPKYIDRIESASDEITNNTFQFYFLDLNLPDGSGFDLIPTIKKINKDAKIVIISAYDGDVELNRARAFEVSGFIQKPFSKKQIVQLINDLK